VGYKELGLLDDVVSVYDQTKTTIFGRVSQKTIGGEPCLGPSVPNWADVQTDAGIVPSGAIYISKNINSDIVRVFIVGTPTAGNLVIACYNHNVLSGAFSYVGKLSIANPAFATTTVFKFFEVIDSGTTNWKIYLGCTATILINGGLFLANKVDLADFTPLGVITIPVATGNDQKANYLLQDPANIGVGQLNTVTAGGIVDVSGSKVYVHNGIAATHQYYVYDTAIAPTFLESTITGTNAAPGVFTLNAHGFAANDPVLFKTTGSFSGLTTNTVYFVRNQTANTFELSATSGGASISTVGTQAGVHSIGRAYGTTGSNFVHKTGNLPALVGTLLINNGETLANPTHASYGGLIGANCVAFGTTSNLYMGKLSELTSGVTTWPSLTTANILGSVNQVVAPTATFVQFSNVLDMFVFISNGTFYYGKYLVNNSYVFRGGRTNTDYYEATIPAYGSVIFGAAAVSGFSIANGIAMFVGSTTGQRGLISLDMSSDSIFERDCVITKVVDAPDSVMKHLIEVDKLYDYSNVIDSYYRTSGFGSATGGWVSIPRDQELSIPIGTQIQFKICYQVLGYLSQTATQTAYLDFVTVENAEISDNWEFSFDDSTNLIPSRAAFRLKYAYGSAIPTGLRFRAYDLGGTLLTDQTIASHPSNFQYSTDDGATWLPLGTIPNVVGTKIRYTWPSPPGVDVRVSLKDS